MYEQEYKELQELLDAIHFTPLQRRIIEYRLDEKTRVEMADKENNISKSMQRYINKAVENIKNNRSNNNGFLQVGEDVSIFPDDSSTSIKNITKSSKHLDAARKIFEEGNRMFQMS